MRYRRCQTKQVISALRLLFLFFSFSLLTAERNPTVVGYKRGGTTLRAKATVDGYSGPSATPIRAMAVSYLSESCVKPIRPR